CQRHVTARSLRVSRAFTLGASRADSVPGFGVARCFGAAAERPELVATSISTASASGSSIRLSSTRETLLGKSDLGSGSPRERVARAARKRAAGAWFYPSSDGIDVEIPTGVRRACAQRHDVVRKPAW